MEDELVGLKEIAERLGAPRPTVDSWKHRGQLPEPAQLIGGRPAWRWTDIKAWAKKTGRLEGG